MSNELSVLVIDPVAEDARRLELCLAQCVAFTVDFHHQPDPAVALRRLGRLHIDVLFIDDAMPAVTGCEVIRAARSAGEVRTIIATSGGEACDYLAADLIRAGADAYLHKRDLSPGFVQTVLARARAAARQRTTHVTLRKEALRGLLGSPRTLALR